MLRQLFECHMCMVTLFAVVLVSEAGESHAFFVLVLHDLFASTHNISNNREEQLFRCPVKYNEPDIE